MTKKVFVSLLSICMGAGLSSCIMDGEPDCPPDSYTVTFIPGNEQPPITQEIAYGALIERPTDPVWAGHRFLGWSLTQDGTLPWDFDNDRVTSDVSLYGQWSVVLFTVAFETNGGNPTPDTQFVEEGGRVTRPVDPTREGYAFIAWYSNPEVIGFHWNFDSDTVNSDITLYARWLEPARSPGSPEPVR